MSGSRIYPEEVFLNHLNHLNVTLNKDRVVREEKTPSTHGAVTLLGGDLYVRFGADEKDIIYGYEQFAANSNDPRIRVYAPGRLIVTSQ